MRKIDKTILTLLFAAAPALAFSQGLLPSPVQPAAGEAAYGPRFLPVVAESYYAPNFPIDQNYKRGDRHLDGVILQGAAVGEQKWNIPTPRKVYTNGTRQVFFARPGDTLVPKFQFSGTWMNGYVFIDFNNDGQFSNNLNADGTPADGSDIVAYSNFKNKNSKGQNAGNGNVLNPPSFQLPSDMAPGIYRMRYKVDWDNIVPGGTVPTDGTKGILDHGGGICDVLLNVHGDECQVSALGDHVVAADGSTLSSTVLPFGKDLQVKVAPASVEGQELICLRIRHGYHLDGDAVVNGNPQYQVHQLSAVTLKENSFTIPGKYLDGNVEIEAVYGIVRYAINVSGDQEYTRTDRHLDAVGLSAGGKVQRMDIEAPRKVYTPLLHQSFKAKAGEKVTPSFFYSTNWMNGYVYLDRGNDGAFDARLTESGKIAAGSDIMTFSHLGGKDSDGNSAKGDMVNPPSFVVPADLPQGLYRMRYKVDWDFIDPAGRTGASNSMMSNGGAICDVMLNVHGDSCKVSAVPDKNGEVSCLSGKPISGEQLPFGEALKVKVNVAPGYICEGLRIRHGYHLDGPELIEDNPQYFNEVIPAYLFEGDTATIPSDWMDGEVRIVPVISQYSTAAAGEDYALKFDKAAERADAGRQLREVTIDALRGGQTTVVVPVSATTVYQDFTPKSVSVVPGDEVRVALDMSGEGLDAYLYIDMNQDGQFGASVTAEGKAGEFSELRSFTGYQGNDSDGQAVKAGVPGEMPVFKIPKDLPVGNYRARLKLDVDNIDAGGHHKIAEEGGYVLDFLFNVHRALHPVEVFSTNGNVYGRDFAALPMEIAPYTDLDIVPHPVCEGYEAGKMTIRLGHHLDGPQYVHGNRQWQEIETYAESYTIPASEMEGDVAITVDYQKGEDAVYDLVFSDEFNGADGEQPDSAKWIRSPRQGATWNRWISDSKDVVYLNDGKLVTRAIANPDRANDPVPMITGAIQSQGKFGFKYGKVECRAKANVWKGTFPAIWLMPVDQSAGWPSCGEIDIFETVNNEHKAYHTIHTHWTYDLKHGGNGSNEAAQHDRYHTYGFEWDAVSLKFYLDGKYQWTYHKSDNPSELNQGQWPFDKQFYLILNQSVGNHNQWASYPDENHIYEFLVDWVRVYQKPGMENSDGIVGIAGVAPDVLVDVVPVDGGLYLSAGVPAMVRIFDMAGRCVYAKELQGVEQVNLASGAYIVNGKKVMIK